MVNTDDMGSGNFLTAKDMKIGDKIKVKVVGEGKIQPADESFKASLLLDVEYNGKPKTMRLGIKNKDAIAEKLGKDSKAWIGKDLEFIVYMTNYQNKLGFQFVGEKAC